MSGDPSPDAQADGGLVHPALEPARLGHLTLRKRVVLAPMSRVSARPDGTPSDRMVSYYASFAEGGFGLVITEGTFTDLAFSRGYADQPGLATQAHVDGWARVTEAVHAHGVPVIAQLMHAGALSQLLLRTAGPSAVQPKGEKMPEYGGEGAYPLPKEMTDADIEAAITGHAHAAANARAAGFDGVEIHSANGYLLDQFITTYTNGRMDRFGGTPEARATMPRDTLLSVRAAVGEDFIVGIRLSQTKVNDLDYRWSGKAEAEAIFRTLADAKPDYLHIASEGRDWKETARIGATTITHLAREVTGLPVITNGGMHEPELAREILLEGHGDFVSLARGALANPDWPALLAAGLPHKQFEAGMITPSASIYNQDAHLASRD